MTSPLVVIFHQPPRADDPPHTALLARARDALIGHQVPLFARAGGRVVVLAGRDPSAATTETFGERLARLVHEQPDCGGLIVMGAGAVPLLTLADARRLVATAGSGDPVALTNNRYSSDVCAIGRPEVLRDLQPLPSDNPLPRWLEERAGLVVAELPGRERLAIDIDTPLDLALAARIPGVPIVLRQMAAHEGLAIPRLDALRALAFDPHRELLVAGRSGSGTLRWLERHVRCRVRFLAEERGLRASSELAIGGEQGTAAGTGTPPGAGGRLEPGSDVRTGQVPGRPPRSTIGRLLAQRGPDALAAIVGELADGAILDTRVLLADRLGGDEGAWPSAEDRFASDLLDSQGIHDGWLQALTTAAAAAPIPILLGAHTIVGPGVRWLLAP